MDQQIIFLNITVTAENKKLRDLVTIMFHN